MPDHDPPTRFGHRFRVWVFVTLAAPTMIVAGCGGDDAAGGDDRPLVVATTSILGDVVRNVVGDRARVEVLMGVGTDPHDFSPSSRDAALIGDADLVVANGLSLEEGMETVLESAAADGAEVIELAALVDPIPFRGARTDGGGTEDPHFWMDPQRVAWAAGIVAGALSGIDDSVDWTASASAYGDALEAADARIVDALSTVAEGRRTLITNHDSLGYFADRYGFEIVDTVIPGGSTLGEPSSADLGELVETIDRLDIPAIFVDVDSSATFAEAVASETDDDIAVVELFSGSLGEPGSGGDALISMLEHNAQRIAEALR